MKGQIWPLALDDARGWDHQAQSLPQVGSSTGDLGCLQRGRTEVPASRGGVSVVARPCGGVQHWLYPSFCALWRGRHHCPGLQIIPTKNLSRTMGSSQLRIMRTETIRRVFMEREAFKFTWQMEAVSSASLQCAQGNEKCWKHVLPRSIGFPSAVSCVRLSPSLPSPRESSPLPRISSFLPPLYSDSGQCSSGVCYKGSGPKLAFLPPVSAPFSYSTHAWVPTELLTTQV